MDRNNATIKYRSESYSGSMVREISDVIRFEVFELGNTDILEYIKRYFPRNSSIVQRLADIIDELLRNGYVDDFSEADQLQFVNFMISELNQILGKKVCYALWLADHAAVLAFYGADVEEYETGTIILSDLGAEGVLYGYENYPEPVNKNGGNNG